MIRARIPYPQRSNPFDHRGTIAPRGAILWAACVLSADSRAELFGRPLSSLTAT